MSWAGFARSIFISVPSSDRVIAVNVNAITNPASNMAALPSSPTLRFLYLKPNDADSGTVST